MTFNRRFLFATTFIAGAAAVATMIAPAAAFAATQPAADQPVQTAPANQPAPAPTTGLSPDEAALARDAQAAGPATVVEELVVTGSRIRRNEFTSSSPIQVITSETSQLQGLVDTGQIVQQSSVASGSFQANNLLSGYVITGGENASTVSLRGLGANRTLVLLNGRRLSPAGTGGTVGPVDLNILPASIIDRVEILKDGASSIYGSDAVAGVVNFITKKNTDGIELDAYANAPLRSGGQSYRLSAVWGKVFDRGYINITADYNEQERQRKGDRDYTKCDEDFVFNPITHERLDYTDPATGKYKCYNAIHNGWQAGDTYGGIFLYDPDLSKAPPGGYPGAALTTRGFLPDWVRCCRAGQPATFPYGPYDSPYVDNSDAISPIKRATVFVSGSYDITPKIEAYTEVLLNQRKSSGTYTQYLFEFVDPTNPNNTVAEGLQNGGASGYARPLILLPYNAEETINYGRIVAGLRGKFGSASFLTGWDWDAYFQYGRSDAKFTSDFIYNDRVMATTGPDVACDPAAITISGPVSCMGIPWFEPHVMAGDFTSAEASFLRGRESGKTTYDQYTIEGSMNGDLFTLPAGKVGVAIGGLYRHDKLNDTPGFNARNSNYWGFSTSGITAGSDAVKEVYGEVDVPLLRSLPLIESLNLSASGRYTDYDSYGSNGTYKVGLDWRVTKWLRFRATDGTSYRAPALYELFLADQTSFYNGSDPCEHYEDSSNPRVQANCAAAGIPVGYGGFSATPLVTTGGGKGRLTAETSEAKTLGVVFTPSFVNLSIAVDYFDIDVQNEVQEYGAGNILGACYGSANFPNDFCSLFTRDPTTHDLLTITDNFINIADQRNRGIDLTTQYKHSFPFGDFTMDTQFTWQFQDTVNLLGTDPVDNNGSTTEPDFTGVANFKFEHGDWTGFWSIEMFSKASDTDLLEGDTFPSTVYNQNVYYKQYTEFTAYHSASIQKKFDKLELLIGVQNIFDEAPPAQSVGQFRNGIAALNAYDLRGRRVFFEVTKRW